MAKVDKITRRFILLAAAREEFIKTGFTRNISEALKLYCAHHPENCAGIPERIHGPEDERRRSVLDNFVRPACRKCGQALYWKQGCNSCRSTVKKNQWVCVVCGFKHITKDTLAEAVNKLKPKGESVDEG